MNINLIDIDGVLNDVIYNKETESFSTVNCRVKELNRIIRETDAYLVISSAWRYMVHGGAMTLKGFDLLLRTHGVIANRVVGITDKDKYTDFPCWKCEHRALVVKDYLDSLPYGKCEAYCVIDDNDLGFSEAKQKFVQTVSNVGLTTEKSFEVIEILGAKQ